MAERLILERTGAVLATRVRTARTIGERTKGLLHTSELPTGGGVLFERARQIHTFGMRYSIDIVFCARDGTVVKVVRALKPWRLTGWVHKAHRVFELPSGGAGEVVVGDVLQLRE